MFPSLLPFLIVGAGLAFAFTNGMNDSSSLAAAMLSSGAARPREILFLIAGAQLVGALSGGVAVAYTVGKDIIDINLATGRMVIVALLAAIIWGVVAHDLGLPTSSAHALIGALAGVAWAQAGIHAVQWHGVAIVFLALAVAPCAGYAATYLLTKMLFLLLQNAKPKTGRQMQRAQWLLAPLVALGQGSNYGQRAMGIIALGLFSIKAMPTFTIPLWLQIAAAMSLTAGTILGGTSVIRTVGCKIYRMRPLHGFAALAATSIVVLSASAVGMPVSTTQIVSTSIAGAGSAQRVSSVRWSVVGRIFQSWFVTIPATAALAAVLLRVVASTIWRA